MTAGRVALFQHLCVYNVCTYAFKVIQLAGFPSAHTSYSKQSMHCHHLVSASSITRLSNRLAMSAGDANSQWAVNALPQDHSVATERHKPNVVLCQDVQPE